MARHLVISVDYEIFGNGTGDVRQHMTEPTESMARICEKYRVPLTVFFEVEEYLAFERFRREYSAAIGYDAAKLVRDQIVSFASRGHDIQLHLHPQWYNARFESNSWSLREDRETVDSLFANQDEANEFIRDRKAAIDELLAEGGSAQRVHVYRAGAFSAQPGKRLLPALVANDIWVDTSVVQGLKRKNEHVSLDYRRAPSAKGPWRVSNDVSIEDPNGDVWEFPIYSVMGRRWQQATFGRLKAKFSKNVPKSRQQAMVKQLGLSRNPFKLARFLMEPVPIKLDFHNLTPQQLLSYIKSAPKPTNGLPDVLVLIGHSKEHIHDAPFEEFIRRASADPELKVSGFDEIAQMVAPITH